ncbi:uncharacterized protein TRAVEDRAFT_51287 [Trametes versicolor FP-101664 SS1]|uniref:uncharacterized protein n=1 Tax=Trametes versicolor (strain FP-101664) TaxID=717944 RepID=UPI0004623BF4|nr:uncharacterized protein TRAVEDRAFT_51287 [Trametes versicolor FP-101664 SS1]EIW55159.1 hypothetical protein TRAVEDRAFT_51287 [Trametes versicolor FP-101664 SS1]
MESWDNISTPSASAAYGASDGACPSDPTDALCHPYEDAYLESSTGRVASSYNEASYADSHLASFSRTDPSTGRHKFAVVNPADLGPAPCSLPTGREDDILSSPSYGWIDLAREGATTADSVYPQPSSSSYNGAYSLMPVSDTDDMLSRPLGIPSDTGLFVGHFTEREPLRPQATAAPTMMGCNYSNLPDHALDTQHLAHGLSSRRGGVCAPSRYDFASSSIYSLNHAYGTQAQELQAPEVNRAQKVDYMAAEALGLDHAALLSPPNVTPGTSGVGGAPVTQASIMGTERPTANGRKKYLCNGGHRTTENSISRRTTSPGFDTAAPGLSSATTADPVSRGAAEAICGTTSETNIPAAPRLLNRNETKTTNRGAPSRPSISS